MLNEKNKYNISILGDSISTYEGYNPYGYAVYYKDEVAYENNITSVNDTWWKKVIDSVGGLLCLNNSYSGSLVVDTSSVSACSKERTSNLHTGDSPDLILIYMGANDRGYRVNIGIDEPENTQRFYGAYRIMLRRIKKNYPSAKIICATLPVGYLKNHENIPTSDGFTKEGKQYNDAIRLAVEEENCFLADIASFGKRYETLDFCHPTKNGHATIAELWLKSLMF